jgi:hypothetical protein
MKTEIKQIEIRAIKRTQIKFAPYNPKKHSVDNIKKQLKNLKRVGYLGGIVWNEVTGNLVSGHKRIMAFDLHNNYNGTQETDYQISVGVVQMDEKTEKEQNVYMDAASTNTTQDYDLLAELIPEIDYINAGLTEIDLNIIGVDYLFQTEEEKNIVDDIENMYSHEMKQKQQSKEAIKAIKDEIKQKSNEKAENMDNYVMLSFDTFAQKAAFMQRFGYDKRERFIKGEIFSEQIERI